jgi:hypothetical protein
MNSVVTSRESGAVFSDCCRCSLCALTQNSALVPRQTTTFSEIISSSLRIGRSITEQVGRDDAIREARTRDESCYESAEEDTYEILAIVSEGLVWRYFVKMSCRAGSRDAVSFGAQALPS